MSRTVLLIVFSVLALGSAIGSLMWPGVHHHGLEATPLFGLWSVGGAGGIWLALAAMMGRRQP